MPLSLMSAPNSNFSGCQAKILASLIRTGQDRTGLSCQPWSAMSRVATVQAVHLQFLRQGTWRRVRHRMASVVSCVVHCCMGPLQPTRQQLFVFMLVPKNTPKVDRVLGTAVQTARSLLSASLPGLWNGSVHCRVHKSPPVVLIVT
jgi:hypothetical protein